MNNYLFFYAFLLYTICSIVEGADGMILRKPYAFLIKNFRLLHAIMFFLMVYVSVSVATYLSQKNESNKINEALKKLPKDEE